MTIYKRLEENGINTTKFIDLPVDQIIKEYQNGMSTMELANKYGCSDATISNRLKENNINVTKIIDLPIEQIIEEYQNGINTIELGKKYNCSDVTIRTKLKENNINTSKFIELPIDQIIDEYNNGMNTYELGKKYDCSYSVISNRLKTAGVQLRSNSESHIFNLPINQIIDEYNNGISIYELGKKYNCCDVTIWKRLKENNIDVEKFINLPTEQIINEYNNGMSTIKIAEKYKCCPETITNRLKDNDINMRTIKEAHNIILTHICIKCGHKFDGKPTSGLCPNCNASGYCYKYDENCREHNREKYNRECFFCGIHEDDCDRKHSTHHIDYNKNQGCDNIPWKLVPLCSRCHGMTSGGMKENRNMWEARIIWLLENLGNNS